MQNAQRRAYRRESTETRKADLIAAVQGLVAEGGAEAATVRAIAARAGVTPGLIRHYFRTKEELNRASYLDLMEGMTAKGADALNGAGPLPEQRLAAFIAASLRPPVLDIDAVGLWAGYMHKVRNDPDLLAVHQRAYLGYRDVLQSLIAALPRDRSPQDLRADAIACNGLIDGLWLEGSILPHTFAADEIVTIALRSIGSILGVDLLTHVAAQPGQGNQTP